MAWGGKKKMAVVWAAAVVAVAACVAVVAGDNAAALQGQCKDDMNKLADCMDYATGRAEAPSETCCADTTGIEKARPQCLCFIIQQVHRGRDQVQSLGLRFDRLLAMPAACKLPSANISLCINLLHLTPGSPDYDLFKNASKAAAASSSSSPASASTSSGFMVQTRPYHSVAAALVSAVFSSIF